MSEETTPPAEALTADQQAEQNLYEASQIYMTQIVPLLTSIVPDTPLSREAFAKAYQLKEMLDTRWNFRILPLLRELHAVNNPPPPVIYEDEEEAQPDPA